MHSEFWYHLRSSHGPGSLRPCVRAARTVLAAAGRDMVVFIACPRRHLHRARDIALQRCAHNLRGPTAQNLVTGWEARPVLVPSAVAPRVCQHVGAETVRGT